MDRLVKTGLGLESGYLKGWSMKRAILGEISPFFVVSDVVRAVRFYREQLGFELMWKAPDADPFFAIARRDSVQIFFKSEQHVAPQPNAARHPSMRWDAYVFVEDPDALAVEFADRGTRFSAPLRDKDDGLRGFEVSDPDGYVLFFGRPQERLQGAQDRPKSSDRG